MSGPRTLVLDNQDSFTFNLVHYLEELGSQTKVVEANGELPSTSAFDLVVISPGPGSPGEAKSSRRLIESAPDQLPILGVCLGQQVMIEAFGGRVEEAPVLRHGQVSEIKHDQKGVFEGLPNPFLATRYHSLAAVSTGEELIATAWAEDHTIQGARHKSRPLHGVQFHPESILTTVGKDLLRNFLRLA